jgi:hypothetical protein
LPALLKTVFPVTLAGVEPGRKQVLIPDGEAAAGVDHGVRLLQVRLHGVGAVSVRGGSVCRLVAADRSAGRGAEVLVWDRRTELTAECQAFRGTLGAKVIICKPADPEAKGLVERLHDYLERSFLSGRVFTCPADFNAQLAEFSPHQNR